jgi:hypothetical protein
VNEKFPMTWRRWRIGFALVLLEALFVAGAGAVTGAHILTLVAVFCAAAAPRLVAWRKQHPEDEIVFDTQTYKKQNERPDPNSLSQRP